MISDYLRPVGDLMMQFLVYVVVDIHDWKTEGSKILLHNLYVHVWVIAALLFESKQTF